MAHQFTFNEQTIIKVGNLLPRLKYAVEPIKVIKWLENFDEDEVDSAIDLLRVYEYIPFNEFMFRLNDLLGQILKKIPRGEKIIIFPYGKVGKSGTLVTYPLRNTKVFRDRNKDKIKGVKEEDKDILLTHDFDNIKNPKNYKHFIFIDDFIGSGKSFCKVYSKSNSIQQWIKDNDIDNVYLLSTIIMSEGEKYIKDRFSNIQIESEVRNKIFDKTLSPLNIFGNTVDIENIAVKHGKRINRREPAGFGSSQSLVSYFHSTPNNTLPIIWSENKKWNPLFPRFAGIRMDEAREFKQEIAFYIGICNKLKIDLFTGKSIIKKHQDKLVREIKHNNKLDHSVIALLFLKKQGYDNIIINHLLGLTRSELYNIYIEAIKLDFLNNQYEITAYGTEFLKELKKRTKPENFKKETKHSLRVKNEFYIPVQFNGMT
ncbi:hypothetical protein [Polaribacter sp. HaHaR_3_91]|uniref:phosphoribosyltransferase-like protein n=1 Tax=Polaribacter sp. HaHaR_3_91 TaxID=2745561 RepID=UPI001C4F070A|nr:hypothetical protein [Polaribacter sp. HaHaR_3_91]QXP63232.1 hypothetical protein H0I27_15490 [Polaribacter sp. HaHaR_3_91]